MKSTLFASTLAAARLRHPLDRLPLFPETNAPFGTHWTAATLDLPTRDCFGYAAGLTVEEETRTSN